MAAAKSAEEQVQLPVSKINICSQLVDAVVKGDVAAVKKCLAVKGINVNKLVKPTFSSC